MPDDPRERAATSRQTRSAAMTSYTARVGVGLSNETRAE